MTLKLRTTLTAATLAIAATLTIAACTGDPEPDPTTPPATTTTTTPTPAATTPPPADEAEAIAAAKDTIDRLLTVDSEVRTAGGTDIARYEELATGPALEIFTNLATRIAKGPIANEDGENVEGQATYEGRTIFEPETAYGQEFDGIPNGLVIVPGCNDISESKITTADGKPAARPDSDRTKVEYQVTYDAERKLWLVSNRLEFQGQTC